MKFFFYLKYFFYLSLNWNFKIAWHIIKTEIKGEKKYCINTTGANELKHLKRKGISIIHATIYMPVNYELLENIFNQMYLLTSHPFRHFLDIGCGKGRALCVAAHHNCKKVTGIDLSKKFCDKAINNLLLTKQNIPFLEYKIINDDAFYYEIPIDVDCIFLFNPFDGVIMSGVVKNIVDSLKESPRKIYIVYVNPIYKNIFLTAGFKEVFYLQKLKYLEYIILKN